MKATYRVKMRSGRCFLVEETGSNHVEWNSNNTAAVQNRTVVVKEVAASNHEHLFKNTCFINPDLSAIEYINTLDALCIERMESELVKYIDT